MDFCQTYKFYHIPFTFSHFQIPTELKGPCGLFLQTNKVCLQSVFPTKMHSKHVEIIFFAKLIFKIFSDVFCLRPCVHWLTLFLFPSFYCGTASLRFLVHYHHRQSVEWPETIGWNVCRDMCTLVDRIKKQNRDPLMKTFAP